MATLSKNAAALANEDVESVMGGITPLHLAAKKGDAEVIELLLKEGADPFAEVGGKNAAEVAMRNGHAEAYMLIKKHADAMLKASGPRPLQQSNEFLDVLNEARSKSSDGNFLLGLRHILSVADENKPFKAYLDSLKPRSLPPRLQDGFFYTLVELYGLARKGPLFKGYVQTAYCYSLLKSDIPVIDRDFLLLNLHESFYRGLNEKDLSRIMSIAPPHILADVVRSSLNMPEPNRVEEQEEVSANILRVLKAIPVNRLGKPEGVPIQHWLLHSDNPELLECIRTLVNLDKSLVLAADHNLYDDKRGLAFDRFLELGANPPSPKIATEMLERMASRTYLDSHPDVALLAMSWAVSHGADVNKKCADGRSTLADRNLAIKSAGASWAHYFGVVSALLQLGCKFSGKYDVIETLNHVDNPTYAKNVLQHLEDGFNSKDFSGKTLLMLAARRANVNMVHMLLENGANPHLKSGLGDLESQGKPSKNALAFLASYSVKTPLALQRKETCAEMIAEAMAARPEKKRGMSL